MPASRTTGETPDYGTWIRTRPLVVFAILTASFLGLSLLMVITPWALLLLLPAGAFGYITLILALARHRFSNTGGQYQRLIHELIRSHARGERVLDIGCGNGHLAIAVAKENPQRLVTGLDYWGSAWEYSKQVCERNAQLEGVAGRVAFMKGSAAAMPFSDAEFDCVVSCLTFHEVRELPDKTEAVSEALRILRPGGSFVFLDLFSDPGAYSRQQLLRQRLEEGGAVDISDVPLASLMSLPFPLNGKRVLKHARLVSGRKQAG